MSEDPLAKLESYLKLFTLHRGEPTEKYEEVAPVYDEAAYFWDHVVCGKALQHYERILAERTHRGAYVLDAGAGTGERTRAILENCDPARVVALDASPAMLAQARLSSSISTQ